MVVLDSSAAVDYLLGTTPGRWVEARLLADPDVHAPHLLDVEVTSVVRRLVLMGRLDDERGGRVLGRLLDLRIARYAHQPLLPRMWDLRHTVAPRDAAFVALAELLRADLVTTDLRLSRASGIRAPILTP